MNTWTKAAITAGLLLAGLTGRPVSAQDATTATQAADAKDTSTDFLSDDAWRALSREERRARSRRSSIARFEPSGQPTVDKLSQYVDRFAQMYVYDPRYFLYNVKAEHVPGTTGSVVLSGEVYPYHYKGGIEDALGSLGFNITENRISTLPSDKVGNAYGISTTSAATLRKEPRRNAEQLNSVGLGGWVRVLRAAVDSDIQSTGSAGGRRSPGAENLPPDSASNWMFVQTMEGYLGFARKADFEYNTEYQLPEGLLNHPVTLSPSGRELPAGVFVYSDGKNGWRLHSGEALPGDSRITDLRPSATADEIIELMKPFMETRYEWGGVTDNGIDCSGFSQFYMRTRGVLLPRDAVQQATGGLIVAWGKDVLEKAKPGDLIFFARENGRVNHVAISLGGKRVIHSAGFGVHISNLDDPDDDEPEDETPREDEDYGVLFARRMVAR